MGDGASERSEEGQAEVVLEAAYRMDAGRSWAVLGSGHLCMAVIMGLTQSFGIFVRTLTLVFDEPQQTTTFAGAMIMATLSAAVVVGTAVYNVAGCRVAMWLGGATAVLGLVSAAFALAIWPIIASLCVVGTGFGVIICALISAQPEYFIRHRRMALGLCAAGASVGSLSMPNFLVWALPALGWRSSLFIYSGVASLFFLCGAVSRSRRPKRFHLRRQEVIRFGLLRRLDFVLMVLQCLTFGGSMAIMLFFVNHSLEERGMDDEDGRYVLMACGSANLLARLGVSAAMGLAPNFPLLAFCTASCAVWTAGILSFSWPRDLGGSVATAVVFGLGYGGMMSPLAAVLVQLFGPRRLPSAIGIVNVAVGVGAGGFSLAAGQLADSFSTAVAYYFLGGVGALSTTFYACVALRHWRHHRRLPLAPPISAAHTASDLVSGPVHEPAPEPVPRSITRTAKALPPPAPYDWASVTISYTQSATNVTQLGVLPASASPSTASTQRSRGPVPSQDSRDASSHDSSATDQPPGPPSTADAAPSAATSSDPPPSSAADPTTSSDAQTSSQAPTSSAPTTSAPTTSAPPSSLPPSSSLSKSSSPSNSSSSV